MKNIPRWILTALKNSKFNCHSCNKVLTDRNLRSLGIRDSIKHSNKEALFIELVCPSCNGMTLFEIQEMNLFDFSIMILDEIEPMDKIDPFKKDKEDKMELFDSLFEDEKRSPRKKPIRRKRSKITLKEIKESAKLLELFKSHDEFLESLGLTPEEINKYKKPQKKDKKNDK